MRWSRRKRLTILAAIVFAPVGVARAGTVHGAVKNGTTGKPAAGVEIILIQLQGGMQPVANSKTDAQGQFAFDHTAIGVQPMLVRAIYKGVNFHEPLRPGQELQADGLTKNTFQVEVFDPSTDPKTINVDKVPTGRSILARTAAASQEPFLSAGPLRNLTPIREPDGTAYFAVFER